MVCEAGDVIPSDGEIIEGVASVDESAITGESAPVIREAGGDRSAVTGGTKVLSDRIVVRITAERGHTFLDRMIALVEGANRQKTPNEIALTILLAALTIVFLPVVVVLQPYRAVRGRHCVGRRPRRAAGLPDPDDHRRAAVRHRDRRDGPPGAAKRAGHVRPGRRGGWGRAHLAARQDRHDHPRQPHGLGLLPGRRPQRRGAWPSAAQLASLADETPEGRSIVVLAKERFGIRQRDLGAGHVFVPFTAQTRMSGLDIDGRQIRKGAAEAVRRWVDRAGRRSLSRAGPSRRAHRPVGLHAARRRRRTHAPRA